MEQGCWDVSPTISSQHVQKMEPLFCLCEWNQTRNISWNRGHYVDIISIRNQACRKILCAATWPPGLVPGLLSLVSSWVFGPVIIWPRSSPPAQGWHHPHWGGGGLAPTSPLIIHQENIPSTFAHRWIWWSFCLLAHFGGFVVVLLRFPLSTWFQFGTWQQRDKT